MKRCTVEIEPMKDANTGPPPPKRRPGGKRKATQDDVEAQKEGVA